MRVRVPASIANLGPGFDVLAMAVDLWLEVEAEPAPAPDWTFEGEGAAFLNATANPLSGLSMRGRVRNAIPMGVGLGSSAAARLAAAALAGLDLHAAFREAAAAEGHPDNAGAAAFGGVRMVVGRDNLALPVPDLDVALLVASEPVATELARAALPATVPIEDAVFNAGRTALLVHALDRADWSLLPRAMEDRLHQPYRSSLYPWTAGVMAAAREAGAHGAAVSGAGPSIFALCASGRGAGVAAAMAEAAGGRGRPMLTRVADSGLALSE